MSTQRATQLVEAGLWLRLSGDNDGARRLFEQAIKLDPDNARARQLLDAGAPGSHSAPRPDAPERKPSGPSPFERSSPPVELDWGMATGLDNPGPQAPVIPPSITPVAPSSTLALGASSPASGGSPEGEGSSLGAGVPSSSTLVFGLTGPTSQAKFDPFADEVEDSTDPMAGLVKPPQPTAPAFPFDTEAADSRPALGDEPTHDTLVFGGLVRPPPQSPGSPIRGDEPLQNPSADEPLHHTLVFGLTASGAPSPAQPTPEPGREGAGQPYGFENFGEVVASSGTLVFGTPPPAAMQPLSSGTMQFSGSSGLAPINTPPPIAPARGASGSPSLAAGSAVVPPSVTMSFTGPSARDLGLDVAAGLSDDAHTAWDTRSNPGIDLSKADAAGVGFDLISSEPPPAPRPRSPSQLKDEVGTLLRGAKDLLDLDDHTGAMDLMIKALELDPGNAEVLKLKDRSEQTLQTMYESKLGDLGATPRVKLKDDEVIWLNLDHRAGFVLAQIDGTVTYEDVFAVSGMSRLDTARILAQLVEEGVISRG